MTLPWNILILTPDQLRADFLGCYGHPFSRSPNIDSLAKKGVRLTRAYCASPACGPSRISFATSTYVSEHGYRDYAATCSPDIPNLVTSLRRAGYRAGMFGKNHLFHRQRLPELWDEIDLVELGNYDGHHEYKEAFSSFTLDASHPFNATGRLAEGAVDFIERASRSNQPFLTWVNFQDPHPAFCCPSPYDTMFDPQRMPLPRTWGQRRENEPYRNQVFRDHTRMDQCDEATMRRATAIYLGQIAYVDDAVGRIIERLESLDLMRRTIILFFSDHGELLGDFSLTHKLPAFYECLTRIPVVVRHPLEHWGGRTFNGLTEAVDLVPTLLEMVGVPVPPTMVGRSLLKELETGSDIGRDSILVEAGGGGPTVKESIPGLHLKAPFLPTNLGPGAMIRYEDWKLSVYFDDCTELYHLGDDPLEQCNLAGEPGCQHILSMMMQRLTKRLLGVKVRDIGQVEWPKGSWDVRFNPLETQDQWRKTELPVSPVAPEELQARFLRWRQGASG